MSASPGSIKTMEIGGRYLFVGAYDETIKVFDIKKYKMMVILDGHLTGITCLKNFKNTLFSGSEEGKIITW
jgi:WD40 repeat protein